MSIGPTPAGISPLGILAGLYRFALNVAILAAVSLVIYREVYPHSAPSPASSVDGKALGRSLLADLPGIEAASLRAQQAAMLGGAKMADVMAAGSKAHHDARAKMLAARVSPSLTRIVPEGSEPADASKRAEWAAVLGDAAAAIEAETAPKAHRFLWFSW